MRHWRFVLSSVAVIGRALPGPVSSASRYSDGTTSFPNWPGVASNVKRGCACVCAAKKVAATTRKLRQRKLVCMDASRCVPQPVTLGGRAEPWRILPWRRRPAPLMRAPRGSRREQRLILAERCVRDVGHVTLIDTCGPWRHALQ